MTVDFADLGASGVLLAEYDAERDAIRIDGRSHARIARTLGAAAAARFVAYAIAHERFHRDHPELPERAAHAAAAAATGTCAQTFERVLRR